MKLYSRDDTEHGKSYYFAHEANDKIMALEAQLAALTQAQLTDIQTQAVRGLLTAQKDAAWIPVSERLPDEGTEVIVYTPPLDGEDEQYDFEKYEDECFVAHHNNYEHFCIVAKGGSDCAWSGPSKNPKYTHWKPRPKPHIAGAAT